MFKNPLKKYQQGGQVSQEEQQILAAFVDWLPKRVKEFQGMQPEQIVEALNGMSKSPEGQKQVQAYMQQFQKEMQTSKTGMFKDGGKLYDFICKHAKGGHVAGCGCGNKVPKGEMGVVIRPTSYNRANGLRFVERQYTPDGQAVYTMATSRETLPSNMLADPYSEYSQNGGEYQGNGQVQIIDNGKGNLRVLGNPYGPTDEGLQHGQDSVNYVNRLRELAKKANIKLGPSFQEDGGIVKGQGGIPEGMPSPGNVDLFGRTTPYSNPVSTQPLDSAKVKLNNGNLIFTDINGNNVSWTDLGNGNWTYRNGNDIMDFSTSQNEGFKPYGKLKAWNRATSGSTKLSEKDNNDLNNLKNRTKNRK